MMVTETIVADENSNTVWWHLWYNQRCITTGGHGVVMIELNKLCRMYFILHAKDYFTCDHDAAVYLRHIETVFPLTPCIFYIEGHIIHVFNFTATATECFICYFNSQTALNKSTKLNQWRIVCQKLNYLK